MSESRLVNRNIIAERGRTSMRFEPELWDALQEICAREGCGLGEIVQQIERLNQPGGRTSAVRVFALDYFRAAATEEGHSRAGHGVRDDGAPSDAASLGRAHPDRASSDRNGSSPNPD